MTIKSSAGSLSALSCESTSARSASHSPWTPFSSIFLRRYPSACSESSSSFTGVPASFARVIPIQPLPAQRSAAMNPAPFRPFAKETASSAMVSVSCRGISTPSPT